jgi:FAD/FMN-containing dehydrogenase
MEFTTDFVPDGCSAPTGSVITFGAGQQFDGIYQFAQKNNVTVVGGSSATVGAAGGWITGGGHSAQSVTLGLGVDNVQQLRVVLSNGYTLSTWSGKS